MLNLPRCKNDQTDSLFNYSNSTCTGHLSPAAVVLGKYPQAIRSEGFTLASTAEFPGRVWCTRTSETRKPRRNLPIVLAIFPIRWTIQLWVNTPLRTTLSHTYSLPLWYPRREPRATRATTQETIADEAWLFSCCSIRQPFHPPERKLVPMPLHRSIDMGQNGQPQNGWLKA